MKIDPVSRFVEQRMGRWGEAILHLGARRAESSSRAQTMGRRETRSGLRKHEDLPRVWICNPIEHLTTEEVWAYLLQVPNPWGGDLHVLFFRQRHDFAEQRLSAISDSDHTNVDARIGTVLPSRNPDSGSERSRGDRSGRYCE